MVFRGLTIQCTITLKFSLNLSYLSFLIMQQPTNYFFRLLPFTGRHTGSSLASSSVTPTVFISSSTTSMDLLCGLPLFSCLAAASSTSFSQNSFPIGFIQWPTNYWSKYVFNSNNVKGCYFLVPLIHKHTTHTTTKNVCIFFNRLCIILNEEPSIYCHGQLEKILIVFW